MTLSTGTRLGPYEITDPLGAGGMGEVYRARDTRLDRDVAIKVLPARLAEDPKALSRFEREAKAVAALSHPNILAIHDFGEDKGIRFVVTELLDGETLRDRLNRERLAWRKGTEIGIAMANGLAAAHAKGIVHRDLKPENVFLTSGGLVKILDFGLARTDVTSEEGATAAHTASMHTEAGTVLGTVGYMSPEQVSGEPADARSDIFSLGCVLYEMLSGRRTFGGNTPGQTMAAILRDQPPEISRSGVELPMALDRMVARCLEKNPNERFQTARDLSYALKEMSGASATVSGAVSLAPSLAPPSSHAHPQAHPSRRWMIVAVAAALVALAAALLLQHRSAIPSLAVLPLTNLTGDPKQEDFVNGMTDELSTALARLNGLRVTSPLSAMKYKDTQKPLAQVARELHVDGIVKGAVTRVGGKVQVKAQLVDASTNKSLWADSFEREAPDVAALQSDLTRAIAQQVGTASRPPDRASLGTSHKIAPAAYEEYVRGRYYWNQRKFDQAVEHFQKAIDLEPVYPEAYAGLGAAYALLGYEDKLAPKEAFGKARAAALKALELEPGLAEAHAALGYIHTYHDYDFPAGEAEFKRAIAVDPNSSMARHFYSIFLTAMLRPAEARVQIEKAQDFDPLSDFVVTDMAFELYYDRKYDEAEKYLKEALATNPESGARVWLGRTYQAQGRYAEAAGEFVKVKSIGTLGHFYGISGRRAEAEKVLEAIDDAARKPGFHSPYNAALTYLGLGNKDKAMELLNNCYDLRSPRVIWLLRDPRWDPMRSDPRFVELLKKIGFPQVA